MSVSVSDSPRKTSPNAVKVCSSWLITGNYMECYANRSIIIGGKSARQDWRPFKLRVVLAD